MSETKIPSEAESTTDVVDAPMDEMSMLRARAATMGIQVAPNMKADTLRKRIDAKIQGEPEPAEEAAPVASAAKTTHTLMETVSSHARKLVRVQIYCNDPSRRDLKGEVFSVSGKYFGTISRLVPYNRHAEQSWHLEHALYRMLLRKKFYRVRQEQDKATGKIFDRSELAPLFTINLLPDLTPAEVDALAAAQAAQSS